MKASTFLVTSRSMILAIAIVSMVALALVAVDAQAPPSAPAQQAPALTLADILIALRSKKLTLPERNKILTDAVSQRGVTFGVTSEITIELQATGADDALMDAIKKKSPIVKTSAVMQPESKPVEKQPTVPEFVTYQPRADASVARGDYEAAVVEYGKVIELKPDQPDAYFSRGLIYLNKSWFDMAIADFTKAFELNPRDAAAPANRGQAWEKKGDTAKAKADYQKALEINPENSTAKNNLARIVEAEAKAQPKPAPSNNPQPVSPAGGTSAATTTPVPPASIDVGALGSSDAVRMVSPVYSAMAKQAGIVGKCVVKISLDEEGNVVSAKAIEGHQLLRQSSEDAAMKSKFKPATYNGKPIKATATITYNYVPR